MTDYKYESESQCLGHDFEPLPASVEGDCGILLGHSRCRRCGVVADNWNAGQRVEEIRPAEPVLGSRDL